MAGGPGACVAPRFPPLVSLYVARRACARALRIALFAWSYAPGPRQPICALVSHLLELSRHIYPKAVSR